MATGVYRTLMSGRFATGVLASNLQQRYNVTGTILYCLRAGRINVTTVGQYQQRTLTHRRRRFNTSKVR